VNKNETVTLIKSFVVVGRGIFRIVSQLPLNFTKTLTHNITGNPPISYNTPFTQYNRLSNQVWQLFVSWSLTSLFSTNMAISETNLTTVLKEQLFVQPVVKPGCTTIFTTVLNEQPLFVQLVVKPRCTTGLTTGCIHDTAGCQTSCQTDLTTGWMFVCMIQPVVEPVWQPVVSCIQTFTQLSNWFWQQVVSCKWGLSETVDVSPNIIYNYHCFPAIMQDNLHYPASPAKHLRILLEQSFTARTPCWRQLLHLH